MGDKALFQYIEKYDCFKATKNNIQVTKEEIKRAYKKVDKETIQAIKEAKQNIEAYSKLQLPKEWFKEIKKGVKVGQLVRPLGSVGCYVLGGNFPLVSTDMKFESPFTLSPALKFAIFFGVILFISKAGQMIIGNQAIYGVSFLSGLADVDAITVSMANLAKSGDISSTLATTAITIAVATNTLVKAGIAHFMGSRAVSKKVIPIFLIMLLCGLISVFVF